MVIQPELDLSNRILINERSKIVDERSRIGNWEIDMIISKKRKQYVKEFLVGKRK